MGLRRDRVCFINGCIEQEFLLTFYWISSTSVIVALLTLPAWLLWNRDPLDFHPAGDEDKAPKKGSKDGASSGKAKKGSAGKKNNREN
jgi:hypothetical protein